MLFAVARLDAPHAVAAIEDRNQFLAGGIDARKHGALGICLIHERAILVGKIFVAAVGFDFAIGAEARELLGAHREFPRAGVEILDVHPVGFVILGLQAD